MRQLLQLLKANAGRGVFRAEGNTLWIHDFIVSAEADADWLGGVAAETVAKQLATMSGPVTLRINSPGGDVFGGRVIQAAIEAYPDRVTAMVDGLAASAASIVAVAADEVVMAPGAFLMIHNAWTYTVGNAADHVEQAALLEKIDRSLADTYAARGKQDADGFARLMAAETWFTAEEAIAAGLADRIAEKADKPKAHWDLSAYRSPPKTQAAPAEPDEIDEPGESEDPEEPGETDEPDELDEAKAASIQDHARRQRIAAVRMRMSI